MKMVPMLEIRQAYDKASPDGHWFSKDTMRYFRTVLPQYGWLAAGAYWFVTSEVNPSGVKAYSVRRLRDGDIDTIGKFHSFPTSRAATAFMKDAIAAEMKAPADS